MIWQLLRDSVAKTLDAGADYLGAVAQLRLLIELPDDEDMVQRFRLHLNNSSARQRECMGLAVDRLLQKREVIGHTQVREQEVVRKARLLSQEWRAQSSTAAPAPVRQARAVPVGPLPHGQPLAEKAPEQGASHRATCSMCVFHRQPANIAAVLPALVTPSMRNTAAEALAVAVRQESDYKQTEVGAHQAQVAIGQVQFNRRPSATPYCGQSEMSNVYYRLEVRNSNGDCKSFSARRADSSRSCSTCSFLQRPGHTILGRVEAIFARGGAAGNALYAQRVRSVYDARARTELLEAVDQAGFLIQRPLVLPQCGKFSSDGNHVVGPIVNSAGTCSGWKAGPDRQAGLLAKLEERYQAITRENVALNKYLAGLKGYDWLFDKGYEKKKKELHKHLIEFVRDALELAGFESDEAESLVRNLDDVLPNMWEP